MADTEPTVNSPEPSHADQEAVQTNESAESDAKQPEKAQSPPADASEQQQAEEPAAPSDVSPVPDKVEEGPGETVDAVDKPATEPAANGATAPTKKAGNGRRKSAGVPEHRSKKLNKKKSLARITHLDAKPGEYYIARLRSYPPWPSIICDEEILPESLLATRPVTTRQADGTYNEAFRDDGKRVHERTFPVMFMGSNEFAWVPNTDLTPLDVESCKNASEKGKGKGLIAAYEVAAEGHDLQYFKDMLADHQRALQEDEEEREAKAVAKVEKQQKKKRKSTEVAEEPEDEEAETTGGKKKSVKKRKKDVVESEGETEKRGKTELTGNRQQPAKTPKTATKLKLTTPKTPGTGEKGKKAPAAPKVIKAKTKKVAKPATSDEEEVEEPPTEEKKQLDVGEAKAKRQNEVKYLRYKLQKGFLTRDQAPEGDEMETMSSYIQKLHSYSDLEVSIIRSTKIHKVLKAIIKLPSIPREEEFDFRGRSVEILSKWKQLLESDLPDNVSAAAKPTTNGIHKKELTDNTKKAATADKDKPDGTPAKDDDVEMPDAPEDSTKEDKVDKNDDSEKQEGEAGPPEKQPEPVAA
ncbi:hypothetical protein FQN57_006126 [Myotisia sp. PD_48]|nr:hypothetical protein FQN57_006126 [Myotisia sp. PD_48]